MLLKRQDLLTMAVGKMFPVRPEYLWGDFAAGGHPFGLPHHHRIPLAAQKWMISAPPPVASRAGRPASLQPALDGISHERPHSFLQALIAAAYAGPGTGQRRLPGQRKISYNRCGANYDGWGVHTCGRTSGHPAAGVEWQNR